MWRLGRLYSDGELNSDWKTIAFACGRSGRTGGYGHLEGTESRLVENGYCQIQKPDVMTRAKAVNKIH